MMRWYVAALIAALAFAPQANAQVTFTEDFDDGAAAGRWTAPIVDAETGTFDGSVDYAFDYGAIGIASAPGSAGTTTGVLMQVNLTDDGPFDEGETVAIIPTTVAGELPDGSFTLSMDVFFNAEFQSSGSTEYATFGVHTGPVNAPADPAVNDDLPFRFDVSDGNGLAWQATGDAGASDDFFRYEDPNNGDAGTQTALGAYDDIPANAIPGGVSTGSGALGPDGLWVEVTITRVGKKVSFAMNGFVIDEFIDRDGLFTGGSFLIGLNDAFNSAGSPDLPVGPDPTPFDDSDGPFGDEFPNLAHFVIFDNVVVTDTVPEPASATLVALISAGLLARRRR